MAPLRVEDILGPEGSQQSMRTRGAFTEIEELIIQSGFDTSQFNQIISLMEISGKVRSLGAGKWIAK
jgi:hypothetical protein